LDFVIKEGVSYLLHKKNKFHYALSQIQDTALKDRMRDIFKCAHF